MDQAEKLIRQIANLLASEERGADAAASGLAGDYAQFCRETNQRLEQCAAMIGKGSDYQALQLAETEPVLLDLAGTLSFGALREWIEYCEANQLTAPERIDAKAVKALNALYAKGISANHPLYKEYRAAVSSRDDSRALQIVKSIVRLNPSDANAKGERLRLENKLFQLKLKDLRAALATADEETVAAALTELEGVAPAAALEELPDYPRALEIRNGRLRRAAMGQACDLVSGLPELQAAGDWRKAGETLSRIQALEQEHGFELRDGSEAILQAAKRFYETNHRSAVEAARFAEALRALAERAEQADSRFSSRAGRDLATIEEDYLGLSKRWRDVEAFGKPVQEEVQTRVRRVAAALKNEIDRLKRRRRIVIGSSALAACLVLGGIAWLLWNSFQAGSCRHQLVLLMQARQVAPTEKFIATLQTERRPLTQQPVLKAKIAEAEAWTREEHRKREAVDSELAALEQLAETSFQAISPAGLAAKMETATQNAAALAEDLHSEPAGRLTGLRNKADAHFGQIRAGVQEELAGLLDKLEPEAAAKLGFDRPVSELSGELAAIQPNLSRIEPLCAPALATLKPPEALAIRAAALRDRVQTARAEVDRILKGRERLHGATTLDEYRAALEEYRQSLLVQAEEVKAARKILVIFPKPDDFLRDLLMPGDPVGWAGVHADKGKMMPADVLPAELTILLALRDDDNLRNIWEGTVTDYENGDARRAVYSREEIKPPSEAALATNITRRTWSGTFYDPKKNADAVDFSPSQFSLTIFPGGGKRYEELGAIRRSTTSSCLNGLYLNYMTDDGGTKYQKPVLRVFDELLKQKEVNPLSKAFLFHRLREYAGLRPMSWGLQYAPSARADFAAIDKIFEESPVRSGDWMIPRRNRQLGPKLKAFFDGLGSRAYLNEARLNRELIEAARREGLRFGGFVGLDGRPELLGEAAGQSELWALGNSGAPVPVSKKGDRFDSKEAAPLSPLFFVLLDRSKALSDAAGKLGLRVDGPGVRDTLPPLFQAGKK